MSSRDPFPSPKLENEFSLSGFRPQLRQTCKKPTHIAQTEEPWSRLYDRVTLASTRRSVTCDELQVPVDSLDLHLTSVYDHNKDLFSQKNQTLYQRETVSEVHRKRENENQDPVQKNQEGGITVWVDPQRRSVHSIK